MIVLMGIFGGGVAFAGAKTNTPVTIDKSTHTFSGGLTSARNSDDPNQTIGCILRAFNSLFKSPDGTTYSSFMVCYAQDARQNQVACQSSRPEFISLAANIQRAAAIAVTYDDQGNCTSFSLGNLSSLQ